MDRNNFLFYRKSGLLLFFLFLILFSISCSNSPSKKQPTVTPTSQPPANGQATVTAGPSGLSVRVSGNRLINEKGQAVRLIGVDYPSSIGCITSGNTSRGIFVAPSETQAVTAMQSWHINAVRITMDEDCWLNINGVNPTYSGSIYKNTIISFVNLLTSHSMYAIIDLHVNAPDSIKATSQQVMADADHAPAYWQSVATTFKNDPAVIFDAYNEPHITTTNAQTSNPWQCWRDGCTVTVLYQGHNQLVAGASAWQGLGMQGLVNAIRSTGATNPIMLGGLNFAQDLTQLLQYLPSDPQHQLIASYHNYGSDTFTGRNTPAYWNSVIASVAQQMPVVTGEFGETNCQSAFVNAYMNWADQHNVSYLAQAWWTPTGCRALGLLSNWDGTPSAYGQAFYNHFRAVNPAS